MHLLCFGIDCLHLKMCVSVLQILVALFSSTHFDGAFIASPPTSYTTVLLNKNVLCIYYTLGLIVCTSNFVSQIASTDCREDRQCLASFYCAFIFAHNFNI